MAGCGTEPSLIVCPLIAGKELATQAQRNSFTNWQKVTVGKGQERSKTKLKGKAKKVERAPAGQRLKDLTFEKLMADGVIQPVRQKKL